MTTLRAPSSDAMTPAQQHAQQETVRVLAFYADEAERWLEKIGAGGVTDGAR